MANACLNCVWPAGFDRDERQSQCLRNLPQRRLPAPIGRKLEQKTHTREVWNRLVQQLKPLSQNLAAVIIVNPVTFRAGRARLTTSPVLTGSILLAMTIGIVVVAFIAAAISAPRSRRGILSG